MKGIILAGGRGTRLYPSTMIYNKHLTMVYNKPMILFAIECLKASGIRDIIISLSYDKPDQFIEFLKDGSDLNVELTYTVQKEPKGIAYAIWQAKHLLEDDKFVCVLADNIFETSLAPYTAYFALTTDYDAVILLKKSKQPERYGVARFGKAKLVELLEKPKAPPSNYIMLGAYLFTPKFFEIFPEMKPSKRNEYEITDAINLLLPKVKYFIYDNVWLDLGTPDDILKCALWLKKKEGKK